jgi:AAA+ ATPase superfamily predicted ATPase
MPGGFMTLLIDRESEAQRLQELAGEGGRRLALLYGRRRIGKTFLLNHAWLEGNRILYFTASATTPEINRRALIREAGLWSGADLREEDHPTWRTVFRALFGLLPDRPIVVVLDEFQYLASDDRGLREVASELNAVWEGTLTRTGGLLVVLSGSAVHTLRALESGGSPLFGRLDWRHRLPAFDYHDAGLMVPAYAPRDRIHAYAAFGGTPMYLDAVDDSRPVADNIMDLLLAPGGRVRIQVESALEQEEGLREVAKYRAILAAVGLGRREIGVIAAALGQPSDSSLKRMVKELVRLEYLQEERNPGAPSNRPIRYRIADPAQRCYYGLILPNESAIASSGPLAVWRERLAAEAWPSYVGREVFEDVVRQAYLRFAPGRGLPAVQNWERWEGQDRDRRSLEIDVAARLLDGRMLTGAVKFQTIRSGARLFLDHVQALERLAASGQGWAREALDPEAPFLFVSATGFKDSFQEVREEQAARPVITWTLDDLF